MHMRKFVIMIVGLIGVMLLSQMGWLAQAQDHEKTEMTEELRQLISEVRGATVQYQDVDVAVENEYGPFLDCFINGEESAMGQHYVNGGLVGDDILDPMLPEALVYEPHEDGSMILVGFEYLVFADVWDPDDEGREPPVLFDQEFHLKTNIPDTPPVWALHLWLWAHNPDGLFADFNSTVFCPADGPVVDMSAQPES